METRNSDTAPRSGLLKFALAIGFVGLTVAVLQANAHQPAGYELSIFGGTPIEFWIGIGIALAVSLVVSFAVTPGRLRGAALTLGGMAVTAIAGLPILRGYYFNGTADALTHLGWARDFSTGTMNPTELFYPGIHSFSVVLSSFAGIELTRAVLFVVVTMAVLTLVFVPLLVRSISRDDRAVVVAAFAVFSLFMVHNLGIYLHAHSFAQATFFTPVVLFVAFAYLTQRGSRIAIGGLLVIVSLAVLLYHPQQAANLLLVFVAISLVQLAYRRNEADHPIKRHRTLYAHTGFLAVAFLLWVTSFEGWAFYNLGRTQASFLAYLAGNPPTAGGMAQSQLASLAAIGVGLPEMFVKLFLVAAIFTALAAVLMVASALSLTDGSRPTEDAVAIYLGVGSLVLLPLIALYFAGNIAEHYFRHIGFLFLVASIVGALALTRGVASLSSPRGSRLSTIAIVLLFAILLPLSLATAFPTPFIHKQTQHVTEPQIDGYQTVFEISDQTLPLGGIRQAPWRFSDAVHGVTASRFYETTVTNENLTRLDEYYDGGGYLIDTEYDQATEVRAYRELRYTERDFRSLDTQTNVNRVLSNGAVRLYHVPEGGG